MKEAPRLLKLFLTAGILFGLLMSAVYAPARRIIPGAVLGLLSGIVFRGIMAGVLGYLH